MARGFVVDQLKYTLSMDDRKFHDKARRADSAVAGLAGTVKKVLLPAVAALGAAFGAVKLGGFVKEATLTAARTQVLGTVLQQVGRVAGYSEGTLRQTEQTIKSLGITTQAARTLMIRFAQSQLDIADAAKIARAAQDLAVISGQNSSEAAETLTHAIAAQRPILLRQFGIVQDLTDVFGNYAKTINKSAEELTQYEKKMAFMNVILEQAARVSGSYEAAMRDAGKQLTSFPRYLEEMANAVGQHFLPAFGHLLDTAKDVVYWITELFETDVQTAQRFFATRDKFEAQAESVEKLISRYKELHGNTRGNIELQRELEDIISRLINQFPYAVAQWNAENEAIAVNTVLIERNIEARRARLRGQAEDQIKNLRDAYEELQSREDELVEELPESMGGAAQDMAAVMRDAGQEIGKQARQAAGILTRQAEDIGDKAAELAEDYAAELTTVNAKQQDILYQLNELYDTSKPREYTLAVAALGQELADVLKQFQESQFVLNPFKPPSGAQTPFSEAGLSAYYDALEAAQQDHMRKLGAIDDEQWQGILRERLENAEKYSEEYLNIELEMWRTGIKQAQQAFQTIAAVIRGGRITPSGDPVPEAESIFGDPYAVGEEWKRQIEELKEEIQELADEATSKFVEMARTVGIVFSATIGRLDAQFNSMIQGAINLIDSIKTGGTASIAGAASGLFNTIVGMFGGGRDNTQALINQMRELESAIQEQTDALRGQTQELTGRQIEVIGEQIGRIDRGGGRIPAGVFQEVRDALYDIGIDVAGLSNVQIQDYLERLLERTESMVEINEDILAAQTQADFERILRSGDLGYAEARDAINYWVEMFDLTAEQQLNLLELMRDIFTESQEWTFEQQRALLQAIESLQDSLEEGKQATQSFRSVTTIREDQANLLVAIGNSLVSLTRQGFDRTTALLSDIRSGMSGGGIGQSAGILVTGNTFYINGRRTGAAGVEETVTSALNSTIRAAGVERI